MLCIVAIKLDRLLGCVVEEKKWTVVSFASKRIRNQSFADKAVIIVNCTDTT